MENWALIEKQYWGEICEVYFLTKHYILVAEEISLSLETFLQPVKEHRDAFDHVVRVYGYELIKGGMEDPCKYRAENLKKALGHVYRAFFDTADWLTFECRKQIRETLVQIPYDEIKERYPQYDEVKEFLAAVPLEIADIRSDKDIGKSSKGIVDVVRRYKEKLDKLIKIYTEILKLFPIAPLNDNAESREARG